MAGELVDARSILSIGQRLEIFFENTEEGTSGYTSRVEDIVGDDLVVMTGAFRRCAFPSRSLSNASRSAGCSVPR